MKTKKSKSAKSHDSGHSGCRKCARYLKQMAAQTPVTESPNTQECLAPTVGKTPKKPKPSTTIASERSTKQNCQIAAAPVASPSNSTIDSKEKKKYNERKRYGAKFQDPDFKAHERLRTQLAYAAEKHRRASILSTTVMDMPNKESLASAVMPLEGKKEINSRAPPNKELLTNQSCQTSTLQSVSGTDSGIDAAEIKRIKARERYAVLMKDPAYRERENLRHKMVYAAKKYSQAHKELLHEEEYLKPVVRKSLTEQQSSTLSPLQGVSQTDSVIDSAEIKRIRNRERYAARKQKPGFRERENLRKRTRYREKIHSQAFTEHSAPVVSKSLTEQKSPTLLSESSNNELLITQSFQPSPLQCVSQADSVIDSAERKRNRARERYAARKQEPGFRERQNLKRRALYIAQINAKAVTECSAPVVRKLLTEQKSSTPFSKPPNNDQLLITQSFQPFPLPVVSQADSAIDSVERKRIRDRERYAARKQEPGFRERRNLKERTRYIAQINSEAFTECSPQVAMKSSTEKSSTLLLELANNQNSQFSSGTESNQIKMDPETPTTSLSSDNYEVNQNINTSYGTEQLKRKHDLSTSSFEASNKKMQSETVSTPNQMPDKIFIKKEVSEDVMDSDIITPDNDYENFNNELSGTETNAPATILKEIDLPVVTNNELNTMIYLPMLPDNDRNAMVEFTAPNGSNVTPMEPSPITLTQMNITESNFPVLTQQEQHRSNSKGVDSNIQCEILQEKETINSILETFDENIQTDLICVEKSTQTIFRVCETFELEAVQLKLHSAQKIIIEMTNQLAHANTEIHSLQEELKDSKSKVEDVQKLLDKKHYSKTYFDSDEKVKYFTGLLSIQMLNELCQKVEPHLPKKSIISPFQQCTMTLIKLKMANSNRDLAYRFDISPTTTGRLFYGCLNAFYQCLTSHIVWPERASLWSTMPTTFQNMFRNECTIIVDCFNVSMEKALNVNGQNLNDFGNTVKFVIGITPEGSICFVSQGYIENSTDEFLTEKSGLLNYLLPGDVILAGRGFNIDKSFGLFSGSVRDENGFKRLIPHYQEVTQKYLKLRMHIDRITQQTLQRFGLVHSRIPSEFLHENSNDSISPLNKIVMVSCALSNLCRSVKEK